MSPRYKKARSCGCQWRGKSFKPTGVSMKDIERIPLYRDELEALRLCDLDGLTQEEAGQSMGVSRGTVQRILAGARRKAALALTQGSALVFEETLYPVTPKSPHLSRPGATSRGGRNKV